MDTLVLDMSYMPVAKVHWQRALTLFFQNKVEIIEEYEDREIRSISFSIKMPSIIRFLRAMKGKKRAIKFSRGNIYMRDNGKCQYCGDKVPMATFTYDHIVPRAQGGKTEWTNVAVACSKCNQKKGNRTPEQAGMKLLTKATRPKKLPDHLHITLRWRVGEPLTWRDWLASHHYWNGTLDEG